MRSIIVGISISLACTASVWAQPLTSSTMAFDTPPFTARGALPRSPVARCGRGFRSGNHARVSSGLVDRKAMLNRFTQAAVEHSDAYVKRKKIHKIASFATLPLFATELALGQSLTTRRRPALCEPAHIFVGTGIIGLFGVNTVTGAWNMFGEDRKDSSGRMLRLVHGLLMMAADAGFVATSMTGPNSDSQRQALDYESRAAMHRNLAIASISVGTAGYLIMLFGNH